MATKRNCKYCSVLVSLDVDTATWRDKHYQSRCYSDGMTDHEADITPEPHWSWLPVLPTRKVRNGSS